MHLRPETEGLVLLAARLRNTSKQEALSLLNNYFDLHSLLLKTESQSIDPQPKQVWDIATGSGVIGLSWKKLFPQDTVLMTDISPLALDCARDNANRLKREVILEQADLIQNKRENGVSCDILLANLPYVPSDRQLTVTDPPLALFAEE